MVCVAERVAPTLVGQAIRTLRQRAAMTQRELAQRAGLERSYVSMLETGLRRNASYEVMAALARALGAAGVHPRVAADLMGHATPNLTVGLYTHTTAEQQAEAIRRLERRISGE